MSVNDTVYSPAYHYYVNTDDEDGRAMITTESLLNLTSSNPDYQFNHTMDSSNVYATFNPSRFNLFGSAHTNFQVGYDNTAYKLNEFSTSEQSGIRINLRYVFVPSTSGSQYALPSYAFRWTGDAEEQHKIVNNVIAKSNTELKWKDTIQPNTSYQTMSSYYPSMNYNGTTKYCFVNDINRNNLLLNISLAFAYIDDNKNDITEVSIPNDIVQNWLKTDTTGFIEYNGHTCFCFVIKPWLMCKTSNTSSSSGYAFSKLTNLRQKTLSTGNTKGIWDGQTTEEWTLTLMCEKYVNGHLYYYYLPYATAKEKNYSIMNTVVDRLNNVQTGLFCDNTDNNYPTRTVHNPYNSMGGGGFTFSVDKDSPDYYQGFFLYPYGTTSRTFDDDGTDPISSFTSGTMGLFIDGKMILSKSWHYGGVNAKGFGFHQYCYSGQEIMAMFACMLLPYTFRTSFKSPSNVTPDTHPDTIFVGKRDADGSVSGSYEQYIWGVTELDKELRPDNFEPVDPEQEATPPTPAPPDSDRSDKDTGSVIPAGAIQIGSTAGFCTYYVLSSLQVRGIGSGLWGGVDPKEVMQNFWFYNSESTDYQMSYSEILDYLVSLKYFPFNVSAIASTVDSGEKGIRLGTGKTLIPDNSLGITNTMYLSNTLCELDGGYVHIPFVTGTFLDFEPCSVASIYVPFCGTSDIKLSNVTGKTLHLKYYIDLVSGCCLALVTMTGIDGEFPVAQLNGVVGFDVMLTGNNQNQQLSSIISSMRHTALNVGGSILSAGVGAISGNVASVTDSLLGAGESILNNAISMPQTASLHPMTAGTNASLSTLCGYMQAFVQVHRVLTQTPSNYGTSVGYITNQSKSIGSISGFTQVVNPDLSGIPATADELAMIRDILTSGFYA